MDFLPFCIREMVKNADMVNYRIGVKLKIKAESETYF